MKLTDYQVLAFDTYGTLIDWETGIHAALAPLRARLDPEPPRDAVLEAFARAESTQQADTPGMIYSGLLATVYRRLADEWNLSVDDGEAVAFGASVKDWPAFADAADALAYLRRHYRLVTLTNCDRESYQGSDVRLGRPWDAIYTAQDVGSYKPSRGNFDFLVESVRRDFGLGPQAILHTAQSLFHDHVPATAAGLATAWIDRRHDRDGYGATMPPPGDYRIDVRFPDMTSLVEAHRREIEGG